MSLFRKQTIKKITAKDSTIIQVAGDINLDEKLLKELFNSKDNIKLFRRLIDEKLDFCKKNVLEKNIQDLKKTTNTLLNYGLGGFDEKEKERIHFYSFILAVFEKNENSIVDTVDVLSNVFLKESKIILEYLNNPDNYIPCLNDISEESQMVLLDMAFDNGQYSQIEKIYLELKEKEHPVEEIKTYYYSLSEFNLCNYSKAYNAFDEIKSFYNMKRIILLKELAKAQIELYNQAYGCDNDETLEQILCKLDEYEKEDNSIIGGCEYLIAFTEVRIVFFIKQELFLERFNKCDEKMQEEPGMQFFLGLFHEMRNEIDLALDIYKKCNWKQDINILTRLLSCYSMKEEYENIIEIFPNVDSNCKVPLTIGLWLKALKKKSYPEFLTLLKDNAEENKDSVKNLFPLLLSIEQDKSLFDRFFAEKLEKLLTNIPVLHVNMVMGLAQILLVMEHAEWSLTVLNSLSNFVKIENEIISEYYKSLYKYKQSDLEQCDYIPRGELANEINKKTEICDWFISRNYSKELFLKEKINCLYLEKKQIEMLVCSKELYEINQDESVAVNILALMLQSDSKANQDFEYYIDKLKRSKNPRTMIAVAGALCHVNNTESAEYFAYKAIFYLNSEENFDVYRSFLGIHHELIYSNQNKTIEIENVTSNVVVTLIKDEKRITICLDSEKELEELIHENRSLGAKHYSSKDVVFLRLQNKTKGAKFLFEEEEYEIIDITLREVYAYRYIMEQCAMSPEKSHIVTVTMESDNVSAENVWGKLKEAIALCESLENRTLKEGERKNYRDTILETYHSLVNEIGVPIDSLINGHYENYVEVIQMLLFGKDQALYAGEVNLNASNYKNIIITFPTLIVLYLLDKIFLLDMCSERIIIPESLIELIYSQVKKATELQIISPGKIVELEDGSPLMVRYDDRMVEMWNVLYEKCMSYQHKKITDQERINYKVAKEISGDMIFSAFNIDLAQMDCLVLANSLDNSIYVCDDLFYRRLATSNQIENANLTSLIFMLKNKNDVSLLCEDLSKTNYIYVPFIYENMDQAKQIWSNLLDGKLKEKYYKPIINKIVQDALNKIFQYDLQ